MREDDHSLSLAERRPRRQNRKVPKRFRDSLPEPLPVFPPMIEPLPVNISQSAVIPTLVQRLRKIFRSPQNIFGLFRQYEAERLPTHDPEENSENGDVSLPPSAPVEESFYPYPNQSSFRLGDWYWNGGIQKSQANFQDLVNVVCDPEFRSCDIVNTKWNRINEILAQDKRDDSEWYDEDAGWQNRDVTFPVPFHRKAACPGTQNYTVTNFYHRNLLSVIREKLTNPIHHRHLHYEPYKLFWQPRNTETPVRVYGELYTSPAFIQPHKDLQASPVEPGDDLPRVIAALMFWS